MDDEPWLLQVLREETDRAVIGEFVQRHTGQPADVRLVRHRADQLSLNKSACRIAADLRGPSWMAKVRLAGCR